MASPGSPSGFRHSFEAFWSKFRKTLYFRILILVLISLLSVLLLLSAALACLSLILIPLLIFLIPNWFGERSVKRHAVNGVIFLLLATPLYAGTLTSQVFYVQQQDQAADTLPNTNVVAAAQLHEGRVNPFRGPAEAIFNFTVNMTSTDPSAPGFSVVTQVASYSGLSDVRSFYNMSVDRARSPVVNYSRGVYYYVNTTGLTADVHQFDFLVVTGNASNPQSSDIVVLTRGSLGPFVADFWAHFGFFFYRGFFQFAFLVFGFFLILLIYWWTRKARQVRGVQDGKAEAKRAEGGGEFTCTNCGADVSEEATKCPTCGAVFEPEAERESAKPIQPK